MSAKKVSAKKISEKIGLQITSLKEGDIVVPKDSNDQYLIVSINTSQDGTMNEWTTYTIETSKLKDSKYCPNTTTGVIIETRNFLEGFTFVGSMKKTFI
jgi:hypothetical protein